MEKRGQKNDGISKIIANYSKCIANIWQIIANQYGMQKKMNQKNENKHS